MHLPLPDPRRHQNRRQRAGPRHRNDLDPILPRESRQPPSRIRDPRRPRVADIDARPALRHNPQNRPAHPRLVPPMNGNHPPPSQPASGEQSPRDPRILGGDGGRLRQNPPRPVGQIPQIPDGRGDNIQNSFAVRHCSPCIINESPSNFSSLSPPILFPQKIARWRPKKVKIPPL